MVVCWLGVMVAIADLEASCAMLGPGVSSAQQLDLEGWAKVWQRQVWFSAVLKMKARIGQDIGWVVGWLVQGVLEAEAESTPGGIREY